MMTRYTRGLTRSSQSRIQGFISICDKTSAFNESPSLRAVRLNQWHGVADGYAFGRWHKWIPGYFFRCCPRQRLQYPWVNFTVRPRLDPGIASFLHQYTDADASPRAVGLNAWHLCTRLVLYAFPHRLSMGGLRILIRTAHYWYGQYF